MSNYPQDGGRPEQKEEARAAQPVQEPAPAGCQCPYGKPAPAPNKVTRALVYILVGFAAAFVIGFGGYAIFLSVQQNLGSSSAQQEAGDESAAQEDSGDNGVADNPVGSGTDAGFGGLTLAKQSEKTLTAAEVYQAVAPSVAWVTAELDGETVSASGVVLTEDGYVVTAAHAIGYTRGAAVTVATSDGKTQPATVVGYDATADIAVLKADREDLTPAVLADSGDAAIGDAVYTVTAAEGSGYTGVLTRGILSAKGRAVAYDSVSGAYLQTDAVVGEEGSGGALVNTAGQVIGITVSGSYLGGAGESYAIPVDQVQSVIEDLIRQGYVSGKVRLGISGFTLTEQETKAYGVPYGVLIVELEPGSCFDGTDVQAGDIITAIGGKAVEGMEDVGAILKGYAAGDTVEVALCRAAENGGENTAFTVTVTLLSDTGETQQ